MQLKKRRRSLDRLLPFLLLCIFCTTSLLFIYYGANEFNAAAAAMADNYNLRTCISYIQDKVHDHDCQGSIRVQNIDGISLLTFTDNEKDDSSAGYLYAYDNKLYELVSPTDAPFSPSLGTPLSDIEDVVFSMTSDHLLKIRITGTDGFADTIYINLNSMKQVSRYE